jgi:hypothetical protein
MNNNDTTPATFAAITTWISVAEAKIKRAELIAAGIDKKHVKLSSYRWADIKDHDKGYICRLMLLKGLRPELEVAEARKATIKATRTILGTFATESDTANTSAEGMTMTYFCRRNNVDQTMTA